MKILDSIFLVTLALSLPSCEKDELMAMNIPVEAFDEWDGKLRVTLPTPEFASGRAAILLPGGGYSSSENIGLSEQWGTFLSKAGIATFSLKYTLPQGNPILPIRDVEDVYEYILHNASSYHINPDSIGIIGFSAGGHLASLISTIYSEKIKLNFQILFYPVISMEDDKTHLPSQKCLLGENASSKSKHDFSTYLHVTPDSPRCLIFVNEDDEIVPSINSELYKDALWILEIPCELYYFPGKAHGWMLNEAPDSNLMEYMRSWIKK